MAQVLKYLAGGTAPKPIKVGNSYYTADLLKKELYGSKLDDYIKFQDFDSKRAQTFRNNLEKLVDAIIDGSLRLEGNSLVDSGGRWKNNGEYAKAKLFGKLNEDLKLNNESLDVANYLIRALNSGKISTYSAPDEYNITTALKGFDNVKDDDDWKKLDTKDRMSRIAKEFTNEANKLRDTLSYRDKYSYEGWLNVDWNQRANATIEKLNKIAGILNDSRLSDLDKNIELSKLNIDLTDYLTQKELEELEEPKKGTLPGEKGGEGNPDPDAAAGINNGFSDADPFNFLDPTLYYNGKAYTYGTPEYLNLLKNRNNLYSEGVSLLDYVTLEINKLGKINRGFAALLSVPEYYKYYSNVTPNFEGSTNIKAAYLLRPDALSSKGSILRIVDNNNGINDYIIDANKGRLYLTTQDKTGQYKKRIVGGKEIFHVFNKRGIVLDRSKIPSLDLGLGIGTTDDIFRGIERDKNNKPLSPTPLQYIKRLVEYVNDNKDVINRQGSGSRKGTYLGSINKILGLNRKGQIKNTVTYSSDKKIIKIKAGDKTLYITLKTPYNDAAKDIHINNVDRIYVNKEGGVLKAQAGIKTQKLTNTSTTSNELPENQLSTSLRGKKTLSKATNAALEATSEDTFSKTESARLNLALLDVGSAVAGILPGLNAVSTATGVASSVGTAIADYVDVADGKMGFWDATKNLGMNLGMDAVSLLPGMKSLKVAKGLKVIANLLPRAMGLFWAKGLITDENQRKALLETGTKLSNGDFSKLNTLDFLNIATLIRMTTLGARDANAVRKKTFGNGKKGDVVITGKVGNSKVTKTISGDDAKDTLGRRFWGMNPKYKGNAKKALLEEANSNKDTLRMDAEGKTLDWGEKDIKNLKVETKPAPEEVTRPKAIFENFLGFGNKGFNIPLLSDKWLATRAFPRFHLGMVTKKDVRKMRTDPNDSHYDDIIMIDNPTGRSLDAYVSDKEIRNMMNEGTYEYYLNQAKAKNRADKLEYGKVETRTVNINDVAPYAHDILQSARDYNIYPTKKSKELIQNALNKQKGKKFNLNKFRRDLASEINKNANDAWKITVNDYGLVKLKKQGGRLDRGFALINAYKSGGYMIPKFWDGGDVNDITYTGSPFLEDVPNFTVFYGIDDLNKYFYEKNTPAQNSVITFYRDHPELLNNGVTVSGKTYRLAEDAYKQSVAAGEFIPNIKKYLKNHTWKLFNAAITKLRGYRKQINTLLYGDELKGSLENQKKLLELIENFNKGYIEILGPIGGRKDPKLFNRNGGATLERHIAFLTSLLHANDRNFEDAEGNKVFLDNAFLLNPGTYPTTSLNTNTTVNGAGGAAPAVAGTLTDGNGKTGAKPGDKTGGARTGSLQYISDLFKPKTRPNPILWLRMAELAGALGTNAKATDELLKYRSYNLDAPYRLAYLYDKYPLIAATQNQVGSLNTQLSTPTTADLGSYLASRLSGFSKGLTAMLNAYNENYNTFLTSKAGVLEAANYNNATEVEAANNNVARAVTAENMKHKAKADLYSANFAQGIKPFLSETRQYMQDAAKLRQKANYDVLYAVAKQKYDNEIAAINENYVKNIKDAEFLKANEGKSDYAIIQAWLTAHPKELNGYKALLETPTMNFYKTQAKLSETLAPKIGVFNTELLAYNFESGGKLTAKDRMKILKVKDYNAARRLDSKESLKSITKDKEEFGKNYRAMSAGTLKMLERTLK